MSDSLLPFVDIIETGDERADVYSMLRLRRGYVGLCRRVRRASDNAVLDVGFTVDGAYDIRRELAWAGNSDVYLARWYNQSLAAGNSRPPYLEAAVSPGAPRSCVGGRVIRLRDFPAIEMQAESRLTSVPDSRVSHEGAIGIVWIGAARSSVGSDNGLWSVHEEGVDDTRTCEVDGFDRGLVRDRGCYYGRASLYRHPTSDFSTPSLIVVAHQTEAPWQTLAWVNGEDRIVNYQGAIAGIGVGTPQLLGPNELHTFIVDGSEGLGICAIAKRRFQATGFAEFIFV